MTTQQLVRAAVVTGVLVACAWPLAGEGPMPQTAAAGVPLPDEGRMPSLTGATGWLNSKPVTTASLRGRVTLVDFWTYTCINWIRTAPYIKAWAEKYKTQGLVVIGVHTPEFAFEGDVENVRPAATDLQITYPIAIDTEYAIWRAFDNRYWPALYIVDARGRIRHHQFGEGGYEQAERVIQALLTDAGASSVPRDIVSVDAPGVEAAPDWGNVQSPENYVGYERTERFTSPGRVARDKRRVYVPPASLRLNEWALDGEWTVKKQAVELSKTGGRVLYRFRARDLHIVMGPAMRGTAVRFRVLLDGRPPDAAHGADVDAMGNGTLGQQRLYQLIRQPGRIDERQFEIEFLDAGAEVYAFTFG